MTRCIRLFAAALLAVTLAACGSDPDQDAGVRLIHAAPDAPRVNFRINGQAVRSAIDYRQGTPLLLLVQGGYEFSIEGLIPPANQTLIPAESSNLAGDTDYTLVLVGRLADDTLALHRVEGTRAIPGNGRTRLQVLHAADQAPPVDIWLTEPEADLGAATPLGTLAYLEDTGSLDIASGTWQLRITPAGEPEQVIFNTGPLSLAQNSKLFITAITNTATGSSPIGLTINTGSTQVELFDQNRQAAIRVIHLSPDSPDFDVRTRISAEEGAPETTLVAALAYPQSSGYQEVEARQYNIRVYDSSDADPEADPVLNFLQTLQPRQYYTVLLQGLFENILQQPLVDNRRSVASEAKLRMVHASPEAGPVDIYLKPAGADFSDALLTFRNVGLRTETGYRSLPPEDYVFVVTPPGDQTVVTLEVPLSLAGGDVRTLIVRDAPGGGEPIEYTEINDQAD